MTLIGASSAIPVRLQDRAAQVQWLAQTSDGQFSESDITARLEEADKLDLSMAQNMEAFLKGEGTPIGGNPEMRNQILDQRGRLGQNHTLKCPAPLL